jgi:hypothetical protein
VLAHADVRFRAVGAFLVGVTASGRVGRVFGHSASAPHGSDIRRPRASTHDARRTSVYDDDDERGTGARVRHRGRHTHHGCIIITAAATTITASVTHTSAWTVRERAKARVGRLKRTHDHATGDVDDGRG